MGFPIHRQSYRTLEPDWVGEVFVADIDRTYLATQISSMKGMARIPFERAADKYGVAPYIRRSRFTLLAIRVARFPRTVPARAPSVPRSAS